MRNVREPSATSEPGPLRRDVEVLLVRHGETVWNRAGRFQGRLDSPLTRRGVAQARALGRLLRELLGRGLVGWRLVSSPLPRAWQSAVLLAEEAGCEPERIELDPRVVEISWGAWDGLTAAEIERRDPELWRRRLEDAFAAAPPNGGESRAELLGRARAWLAALEPGARVVLVSHGTFGRALRCAHLGLHHREMLRMEAPHERVYRLWPGGVQELVAARRVTSHRAGER